MVEIKLKVIQAREKPRIDTFRRLQDKSSGEGSYSVTRPISTTCPGGLARDCLGMDESGTFHGDWQDAVDERTTS
ncbi:hypothetical protein E2C01_058529 [Portunus trituberculatus]|uniref:Uncharacterized protein n=1 Tax=Portunus trituberculatus TaxID=210409 RepID=A0A5B7H2Y3_PORTR|nr:hypothetical protein [Portunus trituberculatus]